MLQKSHQVEKIIELDGFFVEKRSIWLGQYWLFVLWVECNISTSTSQKFKELAKKENCVFIQIETNNYTNNSLKIEDFSLWEYKKFITPYTAIINLEFSPEEILANMKPKGRYNIKVAEKKGIIVKKVKKTDENILKYFAIMNETTSRDNFSWNTFEYYKIFLHTIENSELFLAYKDEKVIAWGIFVFENNLAIYYYWASTSDKKYRNMMAPYLLQWTAILEAKDRKCKIYDFLWVAGPNEKNSPLQWVTSFKSKLTKDIREVSSSFICINKRFHYTVLVLRKKLKKLLLKK